MEQKDYRLAAIMYTDIVGFSRMMERDEAGTLKLLEIHNKIIIDIAAKRHGTVIKTIGDAFLLDFRNTVEALQCAMEVQDALYEYNKLNTAMPLLLRIGVHLGDIYFYENDALGEGINIAARLQSFARPGTICFSQDVYNQVLNKIDFRAEKLGKVSLKNITKEIHAYEIVSPNIEFDPDSTKPHPGYKPDSEPAEPGMPIARTFTPDEAQKLITELRKTILEDTRTLGRRLTVEEALERYGDRGVEAQEVIAGLAEKGILVQRRPVVDTSPQRPPESDIARDIGKAVEGIARVIEKKVGEWNSSRGQNPPQPPRRPGDTSTSKSHFEFRLESAGHKVEQVAQKIEQKINQASKKNQLAYMTDGAMKDLPTGKWDKNLKDSDHMKPGYEELETNFNLYKEKVEEKSSKSVGGFIGHFITYASVNAGLWFIYTQTTPGGFIWPAIVSAAWGIGLVSNFFGLLRSKAKEREIEKMPVIDSEALDIYKKINRVRDSMASHAATVLTVPTLLVLINAITSSGFWWSAIPAGIIVLSFLGHLAAFPASIGSLKKKLFKRLGVSSWGELFSTGKTRRTMTAAAGSYASFYQEAEAARDEIIRTIKADKNSGLDKDIIPTLNKYVDQVKMLTQSVNEIDGIVSAIPLVELRHDKLDLSEKLEKAVSPALKGEYRKSIDEVDRQIRASKDLAEQGEVLKLRMRSSVNALKQLKLDMARLKAMPESNSHAAIEDIRAKAAELAGYMEDLKTGYAESTKYPYAELEKLVAESEERARIDAEKPKPKALPESPPSTGENSSR